jgi:gamma-butyrobetaine dioxygenase
MQFTYLMKPGDLHIFDNHRVLHGRTAFETAGGDRHLQQCSINRDEFHNTLRTMAARLGSLEQNLTLAGGAIG